MNNTPPLLIPVILSGGTGSRLWPLSREGHPKPFIKLFDGETLLEKTYRRISLLDHIPKINGKPFALTITNREYYFISKDELEKTDLNSFFLLEPEARNTAPAISMAALWIREHYGQNATMLVLPADHIIEDQKNFALNVYEALSLSHQDPAYFVTFGIKPQSADTGFGYIESGKALKGGFEVARFYEKPDTKTAENFIRSEHFYWNSGIFCFNVGHFFDEMATHSPVVLQHAEKTWDIYSKSPSKDHSKIEIPLPSFKQCPSISIDYALMEKSKKVAVIPANFGWNDIGSWLSFSRLIKPDSHGNSMIGESLIFKSQNTFIQSSHRVIAAVGVNNLIIVDTPDALLVIDKTHTQDIKLVTSELKLTHSEVLHSHKTIKRPWGKFTTLQSGPSFKIKCIEVSPLKSLSLQSHKYRSEHWIVIEGEAEVINQDRTYRIKTNESTFISQGSKHRLINPLPNKTLKIIEVQSGSYLDEDDIERFDDQYGRV
ncbi:mannose-1-phosphate guanylyltransferase/mannose-6-phosphate isomerase [Candidatus Methylopumilus universalis]|nr:mannose-1-phosphate guanylyltransferase/mannose-6-phosphate isomerase [Candidatus Methylopumilus universalis]